MSNDLHDAALAAHLTDAMQAGTARLTAPADLPARVAARRRRATRRTAAAVSAGVAALTALVVVTAGSIGHGDGVGPAPPAASSALTAAQGQHSHFEVTAVPAGYAFSHGTADDIRREDDTMAVNERVSYRRGEALITLQTFTNGKDRITLADFAALPGAKVVRIGAREVIHVQNDPQRGGLNVYQWTEEIGLDVMVDGHRGATDADVRAFIAGLKRRA